MSASLRDRAFVNGAGQAVSAVPASIPCAKIGGATLYNADCAEVLPYLSDVRLVVTDPPYKLTSGGKGKSSIAMQGGWMSDYSNNGSPVMVMHDWEEWMPLVAAAMATDSDLYVMANDKNLRPCLNAIVTAGFSIHNILIWDKRTATANRWYMKNAEFIAYAWKGAARRIADAGSKQLISIPQIDDSKHPTEKPVGLMQHYIANSSRHEEVVMDPFMGSGTTGVAAARLGRKFIGIEVEKQWFDVACKRIESAQKQGDFLLGDAA